MDLKTFHTNISLLLMVTRFHYFIRTFFLVLITFSHVSISRAQQTDWRKIRNGRVIPDESYSDQPYIVKTDDGAWLCVMTTGSGHEGASGQHIITQRSFDRGQTWQDKVAVEPADGPEASYAVLLKAPSGRIFVFYNHNTDNLRAVKADDPPFAGGLCRRVDSQGHFVFKYSDDHGKTWSEKRYDIPQRDFEIDRKNAYGGEINFFWNVGKPFILDDNAYVPIHKVGGFGEGFFTSNEGALLMSENLLTESDPVKIQWETLPEGDVGLRTPPGGGPIAAEQSFSVLSDGSLYCVYRTIDGHPAYSYSRNGGRTWDTPRYLRYANGRLVKHPRAANFAWKCGNGRYLYWFHNHGGRYTREHPQRRGMAYQDRNPAWIAGGIEKDGPNGKIIEWTQPEILLYDDDPLIRMSYPDLVEEDGRYYITETQKDIARVHDIDPSLLEGLWNQFDNREKTTDGLVAEWRLDTLSLPVQKTGVRFSPFYVRDGQRADHGGRAVRSGFTIEVAFRLEDLRAGQVLLDSRNEFGQGIQLVVTDEQTIRLSMSDGRTVSIWDSDRDLLKTHREHYVSVIVDGGPKIISFLVDGVLNDGGEDRPFGWGRFNPQLQNVNGAAHWVIGENLDGKIRQIAIYDRALRVSEAIGNYRSFYAGEE